MHCFILTVKDYEETLKDIKVWFLGPYIDSDFQQGLLTLVCLLWIMLTINEIQQNEGKVF